VVGTVKRLVILVAFTALFLIAGCADKYEYPVSGDGGGGNPPSSTSCVSCHSDADQLALVAEEDSTSGDDSGSG